MQQEYQIKYLRAAMRDLEGIAQLYLGLAGADSAEKFIDEILHTVDLLRTFPYSGALHPDMVLAERELQRTGIRECPQQVYGVQNFIDEFFSRIRTG